MRRSLGRTGLLVAALASALLMPLNAFAADHVDAPGIAADTASDITDVYAFRSPENNDNLVVVVNVNGLWVPGSLPRNFSSDVLYEVHVDNTGDLVADASVGVTFSPAAAGQSQTFTVTGLGAPITGLTTPPTAGAPGAPIVTESGGIKIFAGPRDDPFFFDLVGFRQFLAGPFIPANGLRPAGETPVDAFAGTNVSSIVLELPITALTGAPTSDTGTIKAWASTSRNGVQVDRMGIPTINTVLIVSNQQKWDRLGAERSGAGWRSGELPEGPVVASSPFGGLSLHLLPAL